MEDGGQVVSSCEFVLASLCKFVSPEEEDDGRRRRRSLEKDFLVLIDFARSSDGRQKLAEANAIPLLLPLLPEFARSFPSSLQQNQFHLFILLLKLLRNLCAGNGINQDSFLQCKGLETLAWIAHSLLESSPSTRRVLPPPHAAETLQMLLQVVANVAGRGELSQAVVWENFFPAIFGGVAEVLSQKVQEPLCMVLSTCCKGSKKSCMEILSSQGIPIIASILNADMSYGGGSMVARNEWLEMLITHLCLIEEQCFPLLFTELGIPRTTTQHLPQQPEAPLSHKLETKLPSKEQASLLEILCVWIEEDGGKAMEETAEGGGDSLTPPRPPLLPMECAGFLVDVIQHAAQCAASDGLCATAFPTNMPVLDVLGLSLSMARIHCAWDKTLTSAKEPNGETITMAAKLASNGLIALMLDMLQALGPPQSARPGVPPEHSTNKKSFPTWDPYKGYRRDIVAVIANASYRNFHIQEEVREADGLYLVLEQCTTDSNNPFLREWGLWAIRNLLEGNPRNQHEFADLEAKASVANPELRDIGISVELNPETGRPRLVNVSNAEGNH
ncbi:unnamed protein product [Sphagnum balticum]